jgi:probable O-glycosylation ligase (exosortase A-associated)
MFEETFQMKHMLFLTCATLLGGLGAIYHPFWGILLYYTLAVLRPQYLWKWALPMQLRWSLFASLIVFVSLMINAGRGFFRLRLHLMPCLILLYCLLLLGSMLNAYFPQTAQYWGIEYGKIMLMALIASLILDRLWQVRTIYAMIVITIGYVAWEINYLYVVENRLDIYHHGYGGLDNNGAGLMLAMCIPIAYAFATSAKSKLVKMGCWFLALLMLHATLMSYSRGAMLSLTVGIIWILINHRPRYQAAILLALIVLLVPMLAGQEIRERFFSTSQYSSDNSAQSRLDSWSAGWAIAMENPITGQGIRNSSYFIQNYGADRVGRTIHSQYIQIAADSGILAMITYIIIQMTAFWSLRRSRNMCSRYVKELQYKSPDSEPDHLTVQTIQLAMGCEASLLIFSFGAIFLSVEVVELPWLLLVVASVMPHITHQHIAHLSGAGAHESEDALVHAHNKIRNLDNPPITGPMPEIIRGLLTP